MGARFRRSACFGPLRFNLSKAGRSLLSWRGGASFNIPVAQTPDRSAAIPAYRAVGLSNSRRLRPGQLKALKQSLLAMLRQELFAPSSTGGQLWERGLVSRLLADDSIGARTTGLLAVIETPEAMESYL